MKLSIIIPHRPRKNSINPQNGVLYQNEKFDWLTEDGVIIEGRHKKLHLPERAIMAINKNSEFKHDIIVGIDGNMHPHKDWLKEYDNVRIFKNNYNHTSDFQDLAPNRLTALEREIIFSLPDDNFVCHGYLDTLICANNWDLYLSKAIEACGDEITYAPMWVETMTSKGAMSQNIGDDIAKADALKLGSITYENIWNKWRKLCSHVLLLPPSTMMSYISEKYFNKWIKIATSKKIGEDGIILERCGRRNYGYWCGLISKNYRFKKVLNKLKIGDGWDLAFEASLGVKAVVTNSFLLHTYFRVILSARKNDDSIQVYEIPRIIMS